MPNIALAKMTEEEALTRVIAWLKPQSSLRRFNSPDVQTYGHDLYIPALVNALLCEMSSQLPRPQMGITRTYFDQNLNTEELYAAAWNLCRRGVMYPSSSPLGRQIEYSQIPGAGFMLTEYGEQWLSGLENECVPSEYGRFSQLLNSHGAHFGHGYLARSQEAISCYRAHAYLATCAMCGGAAESILLAVAIARVGNEEEVLKAYRTGSGRSKIETIVLAQQNSHVMRELPNFTALIHYWRDESAHGAQSNISEEEAFTSLILLLRFAQFADSRWDELTVRIGSA